MKVTLKYSKAGPDGNWGPGSVIEVSAKDGAWLISERQASLAPNGAKLTPSKQQLLEKNVQPVVDTEFAVELKRRRAGKAPDESWEPRRVPK